MAGKLDRTDLTRSALCEQSISNLSARRCVDALDDDNRLYSVAYAPQAASSDGSGRRKILDAGCFYATRQTVRQTDHTLGDMEGDMERWKKSYLINPRFMPCGVVFKLEGDVKLLLFVSIRAGENQFGFTWNSSRYLVRGIA